MKLLLKIKEFVWDIIETDIDSVEYYQQNNVIDGF